MQTKRRWNAPGVAEQAMQALRTSIREMERVPGSSITMCHRQGKTAVYLADDDRRLSSTQRRGLGKRRRLRRSPCGARRPILRAGGSCW